MTMSRGDRDLNLYSFDTRDWQERAFWHPGVGMWQLDDIGLGAFMSANQRINVATAAPTSGQHHGQPILQRQRYGSTAACRGLGTLERL